MAKQRQTSGRLGTTRDRDSIPVLVVRLGPARDFLIALAVVVVTLVIAMVVAYLVYG